MRALTLAVILFAAGIVAEVEYESEPDAVEQDKKVDRNKDGKIGPAYLDYAPQCNIHPNYLGKSSFNFLPFKQT